MLNTPLLAALAKARWDGLGSFSHDQLNALYAQSLHFFRQCFVEEKTGIELLYAAADKVLLAAYLQETHNKETLNYYLNEMHYLDDMGVSRSQAEVVALLKAITFLEQPGEVENFAVVQQMFTTIPPIPEKRKRGRRSQENSQEIPPILKKHPNIYENLWLAVETKMKADEQIRPEQTILEGHNETEVINIGLFLWFLFYQ